MRDMTAEEKQRVMRDLAKFMPKDISEEMFRFLNEMFQRWVENAEKVMGTGDVPVGVWPLLLGTVAEIHLEELCKAVGHDATDYVATLLEGVTKRVLQSDVVDVEKFLTGEAVTFLRGMNRQVYRMRKGKL